MKCSKILKEIYFTNLNDWEPNTAYTAGTKVKWNKQIYFARVDHTSGTSSYQAFSNNQTWFRYASIYDFTEMWDYADYSIVGRKTNEQPTQALSNKLELNTVDTVDTDGHLETLLDSNITLILNICSLGTIAFEF